MELRSLERGHDREDIDSRIKSRIDEKTRGYRERSHDADPRRDRHFDHRSRHQSRGSKEEMEQEKHEKFLNLIKGRYDEMTSRLNRLDFPEHERKKLIEDVAKYYRLELEVIDGRHSTSKEFEKARDMHNKEERRAHLESVRNRRENERDHHLSKRDEARAIRDRIMKITDEKMQGGSEL